MAFWARKKTKVAPVQQVYKMMMDVGNGFYTWNGKLYHSDIVRSCIKPKTKAIGKAIAKHIRTTIDKDGKKTIEINPMLYIEFLLNEPNEYMTGQMLQEKVANQLALNGNAFILILRDENELPNGLYPIPCTSVEKKIDDLGELELKFWLPTGKYLQVYYRDLIHIRDDYLMDDVFGDAPAAALKELMETVSTIDQGIRNAIKNSAIVRWLLKYTNAIRDEDLKIKAKEFADNYLNISNGAVGVAAVDAKADAIQVNNNDFVPNAAQIDKQTERIYAFFQTNDKIVHSKYNEDEWIAYYEAAIEPIIQQMANEYTRRLFSRRERSFGNKIIFETSSLTFASMSTKLNLVQFIDRGVMTPNEVRELLSMAPIEGGDKALLRKDTGTLKGGD